MELEVQQHMEEDKEEERMEEVQKKFTLKVLAGVFTKVSVAMLELEGMDPNVKRYTKVERQINEVLLCYHEISEEKKLQSKPH